MARSRGNRGAFSQPQRRQSSTAAPLARPSAPVAPPAAVGAGPQAGSARQPGMFAQMASTAAGVAVGSAVGHTLGAGITGMFSGSEPAQVPAQATQSTYQQQNSTSCDIDARNFTRCIDDNNGNPAPCEFYLQQLRACQEAARLY